MTTRRLTPFAKELPVWTRGQTLHPQKTRTTEKFIDRNRGRSSACPVVGQMKIGTQLNRVLSRCYHAMKIKVCLVIQGFEDVYKRQDVGLPILFNFNFFFNRT